MFKKLAYFYSRFGFDGMVTAIKAGLSGSNDLITVQRPGISHPFYLRCHTSDIPTYDIVFTGGEYDLHVAENPKVIIDAGANIGLASIFFANRFPAAKIIAIEPEESNFQMLKKNVQPYSNITPLNVALWDKNEDISLVDPGLDKWGFMTKSDDGTAGSTADNAKVCHRVKGMTVDRIMDDFGISRIGILKIDIEGAEREVFTDSSAWIERVDALIVELHDRMKSGCCRSFYHGTNGFDTEWSHGESVYLGRRNCIRPRNYT